MATTVTTNGKGTVLQRMDMRLTSWSAHEDGFCLWLRSEGDAFEKQIHLTKQEADTLFEAMSNFKLAGDLDRAVIRPTPEQKAAIKAALECRESNMGVLQPGQKAPPVAPEADESVKRLEDALAARLPASRAIADAIRGLVQAQIRAALGGQ